MTTAPTHEEFNAAIAGALQAAETRVAALVSHLDKRYRSVWAVERDAYMRRYQRANKSAAAVEADIARYAALAEQVAVEEPLVVVGPLQVDVTPFKQVVIRCGVAAYLYVACRWWFRTARRGWGAWWGSCILRRPGS